MAPFQNPSDDETRALLEKVKRIAVIGLSPKTHRASHSVSRYLQDAGYEIVPVYPRLETILGQKVYRNVRDVPGPIDLVNVFRRSEFLPTVFDDVISSGAGAVWTQLQCIDQDGARRAQAAGLTVVMNRCLAVEHGRLLG